MKKRRHEAIKDLISKEDVETQEDLLNSLKESGFDVTQATISRDIKELRLVKTLSSSGKYRYSTGQENIRDISTRFYSLFSDAVFSVETAQNMIVIKTVNGMAQAVCAAMDSQQIQGFIGTLAGEDTIFVVCKTSDLAFEKAEKLRKLIIG